MLKDYYMLTLSYQNPVGIMDLQTEKILRKGD